MISWFHKLMHPHCPDCIQEREASRRCGSCEILQIENERLHIENEKLLDKLLSPQPNVSERLVKEPKLYDEEELKKVTLRHLPWATRRQMLEAEDRASAKLLADKKKNLSVVTPDNKQNQSINGVAELEKALAIDETDKGA